MKLINGLRKSITFSDISSSLAAIANIKSFEKHPMLYNGEILCHGTCVTLFQWIHFVHGTYYLSTQCVFKVSRCKIDNLKKNIQKSLAFLDVT